jgi:multiple sugar transport system substrate-binding protein
VFDRRQFLKAAGAGAAALATMPLLEACSSSSAGSSSSPIASTAPSNLTGHVSLGFFGASDIVKAWTPIFDDFRKTYPKITLEAVPVPAPTWTAYADSVILQLSGGKEFDVVQAAVNVQQLFISKGVVQPLDDFMKRDQAEIADYLSDENSKFLDWNKNLVSKGGSVYYLPADYNSYCMWVNTKMLQDAGVPVPENGWTWDDLMAAGPKVCTSPGKYLVNVDAGDMFFFQPWALTNGGTLLSADWTQSTLADPKTIEAAAFAQSLCQKGYSPKPGGSFDAVTAFAQDKLAMFGCGMWLNPSIKEAGAADKAKVVSWPQKTAKGTSVGWNAYPIIKNSQNKEAAWAFLKYLASKQAVTNLAATGQSCPGRKSVFFSDTLKQACPEPGIEELWNAVDYATPVPSPDQSDAINAAIIKTLTQLYSSDADATQLMTALDTEVKGYLSGSTSGG